MEVSSKEKNLLKEVEEKLPDIENKLKLI